MTQGFKANPGLELANAFSVSKARHLEFANAFSVLKRESSVRLNVSADWCGEQLWLIIGNQIILKSEGK
jgi:hypothetical protein